MVVERHLGETWRETYEGFASVATPSWRFEFNRRKRVAIAQSGRAGRHEVREPRVFYAELDTPVRD